MVDNQEKEIINVKENPELYIVDNGLKGMYTFEPYKSLLLPLFKYKSQKAAKRSTEKLLYQFNKNLGEDFIACNMCVKYLRAGVIFSRRYNRYGKSGRVYDENGERKGMLKIKDRDKEKMDITRMYEKALKECVSNEEYKGMKKVFHEKYK